MKLKLSKTSVQLLNNILLQPWNLNAAMQQSGMTQPSGAPRPFASPTPEHALSVQGLRKWLKEHVMTKGENNTFLPPETDGTYALAQRYVEVLKEIVAYYQPLGLLVESAEFYLALKYALDGKTLEEKVESIGDILGGDADDLPEKEKEKDPKTAAPATATPATDKKSKEKAA